VTLSADDSWSALQDWARGSIALPITAHQWEQLRLFVDELLLWNGRMALVSQRDLPTVLAKHVADSLVAASHCAGNDRIADLGSGAGFPGIPIAILRPETSVCLMESIGKKVSFLQAARRAAGLSNLEIYEGRIEAACDQAAHRNAYDLVTSRALAGVDRLRSLARPLLAPGGRLLAMRSERVVDGEPGLIIRYELPDGTPRTLHMFPVEPSVTA
jgi:16S rRNA (guanine527-N7)-methyltransferase